MPAQQGADATAGRLEEGQVRAMFDRIAVVYDLLNTVMSAGLHHRWRARAVDEARVGPGSRVLDVATGTGDLAIELARRVSPGGEVLGSDFSENMLARARIKGAKALRSLPSGRPSGESSGESSGTPNGESSGEPSGTPSGEPGVHPATARSTRGPRDSPSSGATHCGCPIPTTRSTRPRSALAPATSRTCAGASRRWFAWCAPGGRVVVLEMTTPTRPPLSLFYRLWFDRAVPLIGRLAGALAALPSRGASSPSERSVEQAEVTVEQAMERDETTIGQAEATIAPTIAQAYTYLPSSVRRFHSPAELAAELERAGCDEIGYVLMAGGIVAVHGATVPG